MRAQAADGQRQLAPRRDDEQRARREVPDDRLEDVARVLGRQDVRVVEDEHERLAAARDRRPETCDRGVQAVLAARAQAGDHAAPEGLDLVEGEGDRGDQARGIGVGGIEREPRERARVAGGPLRQRRRLAVAGRGDDERERHVAGLREALDEARARHEAGAERRRAAVGRDGRGGDVAKPPASVLRGFSEWCGRRWCHPVRPGSRGLSEHRRPAPAGTRARATQSREGGHPTMGRTPVGAGRVSGARSDGAPRRDFTPIGRCSRRRAGRDCGGIGPFHHQEAQRWRSRPTPRRGRPTAMSPRAAGGSPSPV